MRQPFFKSESLSVDPPMTIVLKILSLASSILGVFWGSYALANGFRTVSGDPFYFIPQAAGFLVLGAAGWATFGALAQILQRLEKLEFGEPS